MPAYRQRIFVIPSENDQPIWIGEFPYWWDRMVFFEKYSQRQIDIGNPFYVDYGLLLTGWEASEWDRRCREIFSNDPRSRDPFFKEASQNFETLLRSADWVVVESYEWESGLS